MHDVALIQLKHRIKKSQFTPMEFGNPPSSSPTNVIVAGYGVKGSGKSSPQYVSQATVVYQSKKVCNDWLGFKASNGRSEICTTSLGFPKKGKMESCFGDSGGPLIHKSDGKIRLIGVISYFYGDKCQSPGAADYSMSVSFYKKQILRLVRKGKRKGWRKM